MKVRINLSLPHDDLEWLNEAYSHVTTSAILTLLLHEFRAIHRDTGVTPKKVARDSAKEIKERIDEGLFDETTGEEN